MTLLTTRAQARTVSADPSRDDRLEDMLSPEPRTAATPDATDGDLGTDAYDKTMSEEIALSGSPANRAEGCGCPSGRKRQDTRPTSYRQDTSRPGHFHTNAVRKLHVEYGRDEHRKPVNTDPDSCADPVHLSKLNCDGRDCLLNAEKLVPHGAERLKSGLNGKAYVLEEKQELDSANKTKDDEDRPNSVDPHDGTRKGCDKTDGEVQNRPRDASQPQQPLVFTSAIRQSCVSCRERTAYRTGPDGQKTLCDSCYRRYIAKKLPLYLDQNERPTACVGPSSRRLAILGFQRIRGGVYDRRRPIVLPIQAGSDEDRDSNGRHAAHHLGRILSTQLLAIVRSLSKIPLPSTPELPCVAPQHKKAQNGCSSGQTRTGDGSMQGDKQLQSNSAKRPRESHGISESRSKGLSSRRLSCNHCLGHRKDPNGDSTLCNVCFENPAANKLPLDLDHTGPPTAEPNAKRQRLTGTDFHALPCGGPGRTKPIMRTLEEPSPVAPGNNNHQSVSAFHSDTEKRPTSLGLKPVVIYQPKQGGKAVWQSRQKGSAQMQHTEEPLKPQQSNLPVKCIACVERKACHTGPDGFSSLCYKCYLLLRSKELPLYLADDGALTAVPDPGALRLRVTGFARIGRGRLDLRRPQVLNWARWCEQNSRSAQSRQASCPPSSNRQTSQFPWGPAGVTNTVADQKPAQDTQPADSHKLCQSIGGDTLQPLEKQVRQKHCLVCRRYNPTNTGPDGYGTLCGPCHRAYVGLELPLYGLPGGQGLTAVCRKDAPCFKVIDFPIQHSKTKRNLLHPCVQPVYNEVSEQYVPSSTRRTQSSVSPTHLPSSSTRNTSQKLPEWRTIVGEAKHARTTRQASSEGHRKLPQTNAKGPRDIPSSDRQTAEPRLGSSGTLGSLPSSGLCLPSGKSPKYQRIAELDRCLRCGARRKSVPLRTGPDGYQTLCLPCSELYRTRCLQVFQHKSGQVSVVPASDAKTVAVAGFVPLKASGHSDLLRPIVCPVTIPSSNGFRNSKSDLVVKGSQERRCAPASSSASTSSCDTALLRQELHEVLSADIFPSLTTSNTPGTDETGGMKTQLSSKSPCQSPGTSDLDDGYDRAADRLNEHPDESDSLGMCKTSSPEESSVDEDPDNSDIDGTDYWQARDVEACPTQHTDYNGSETNAVTNSLVCQRQSPKNDKSHADGNNDAVEADPRKPKWARPHQNSRPGVPRSSEVPLIQNVTADGSVADDERSDGDGNVKDEQNAESGHNAMFPRRNPFCGTLKHSNRKADRLARRERISRAHRKRLRTSRTAERGSATGKSTRLTDKMQTPSEQIEPVSGKGKEGCHTKAVGTACQKTRRTEITEDAAEQKRPCSKEVEASNKALKLFLTPPTTSNKKRESDALLKRRRACVDEHDDDGYEGDSQSLTKRPRNRMKPGPRNAAAIPQRTSQPSDSSSSRQNVPSRQNGRLKSSRGVIASRFLNRGDQDLRNRQDPQWLKQRREELQRAIEELDKCADGMQPGRASNERNAPLSSTDQVKRGRGVLEGHPTTSREHEECQTPQPPKKDDDGSLTKTARYNGTKQQRIPREPPSSNTACNELADNAREHDERGARAAPVLPATPRDDTAKRESLDRRDADSCVAARRVYGVPGRDGEPLREPADNARQPFQFSTGPAANTNTSHEAPRGAQMPVRMLQQPFEKPFMPRREPWGGPAEPACASPMLHGPGDARVASRAQSAAQAIESVGYVQPGTPVTPPHAGKVAAHLARTAPNGGRKPPRTRWRYPWEVGNCADEGVMATLAHGRHRVDGSFGKIGPSGLGNTAASAWRDMIVKPGGAVARHREEERADGNEARIGGNGNREEQWGWQNGQMLGKALPSWPQATPQASSGAAGERPGGVWRDKQALEQMTPPWRKGGTPGGAKRVEMGSGVARHNGRTHAPLAAPWRAGAAATGAQRLSPGSGGTWREGRATAPAEGRGKPGGEYTPAHPTPAWLKDRASGHAPLAAVSSQIAWRDQQPLAAPSAARRDGAPGISDGAGSAWRDAAVRAPSAPAWRAGSVTAAAAASGAGRDGARAAGRAGSPARASSTSSDANEPGSPHVTVPRRRGRPRKRGGAPVAYVLRGSSQGPCLRPGSVLPARFGGTPRARGLPRAQERGTAGAPAPLAACDPAAPRRAGAPSAAAGAPFSAAPHAVGMNARQAGRRRRCEVDGVTRSPGGT